LAMVVRVGEAGLGVGMSLLRGGAKIFRGLGVVLGDVLAVGVGAAEFVLRSGVALGGFFAERGDGVGVGWGGCCGCCG